MKPYLFYLFCICIFAIACNGKSTDQSKNETKESPADEVKNDKPANHGKESECFRYFGNKDSVYLQLSEVYGMMTGMLLIKNYQKDQNLGTLQGKMMGDILLAEYSFKSEGKISVRQVAFRKKGDDYIEGFGDVQEVNGKSVFKDTKTLKFDESRVYAKVPCKN
ncbi:MAG: hypothetical protein WBP41_04525 [Saprospiraceae bacterium]